MRSLFGLAALGLCFVGLAYLFFEKVNAQNPSSCVTFGGSASVRIDSCTKLIESNKLNDTQLAQALFNRGAAYDDNHQYDLAISDYTNVISLTPNFAFAYNARGAVYDERSQWDLALADYNHAIQLQPSLAYAWANRGLIEVRRGQLAQAVADYNVAVEKDPINYWALYGRGIARKRAGDSAGGSADIATANRLAPDVAKNYAGIGIQP